MSGFAATPIDKVRIGIIGMGQRGPAHMVTMSHVEGVEIKALCDLRPEKSKCCKKTAGRYQTRSCNLYR